jgi:uncharacterized protein with HEPN domain
MSISSSITKKELGLLMAGSSIAPRLTDILDAIAHIRGEMAGVSIEAFEADWRKRWLVERGVEIISEASRRLTDDLKSRHPEIPGRRWRGSEISRVTNTRRFLRR